MGWGCGVDRFCGQEAHVHGPEQLRACGCRGGGVALGCCLLTHSFGVFLVRVK